MRYYGQKIRKNINYRRIEKINKIKRVISKKNTDKKEESRNSFFIRDRAILFKNIIQRFFLYQSF